MTKNSSENALTEAPDCGIIILNHDLVNYDLTYEVIPCSLAENRNCNF